MTFDPLECPHCSTLVLPTGDGVCPNCRCNINEELTPEQAANVAAARARFAEPRRMLTSHRNPSAVSTANTVPTVAWLPSSATNISYYRSYSFTAYEFDIPETEFRAWSRCELAEIDDPVTITRYTRATSTRPSPSPNPTDDEIKAFVEAEAEQSATIDDGLYYERTQANGGGERVAYDRKLGRGFYVYTPR
jgi:hypothetical protein